MQMLELDVLGVKPQLCCGCCYLYHLQADDLRQVTLYGSDAPLAKQGKAGDNSIKGR